MVGTWTRRLRNRQQAEDLAHDTFVRVLESDSAAVEQSRAYLHQTARNITVDGYRREDRRGAMESEAIDLSESPTGDPEHFMHAIQLADSIERALCELPVNCRKVFVWQKIEGLSQAEIAERLVPAARLRALFETPPPVQKRHPLLRYAVAASVLALGLGVTDIKVVGDWLGDADAAVVQNHPGARTVIRREAMVEQGAMNVGDVLKRVPGVQVQDANGTGGSDISLNVGVHGLTSRLSPRSTVLIDGVPAAFAPYGQPQLSMAPISSGNLDSVDVVRGAGSVRYGPQNVGGVINFVTRAIPEKATAQIGTTLETSQHGGWKHIDTAFMGGTADNGMGVALLYSGVNGNGYRESNNGNDIDDVIPKTHWAPTDVDDFSLNFHYYDAKSARATTMTCGAAR